MIININLNNIELEEKLKQQKELLDDWYEVYGKNHKVEKAQLTILKGQIGYFDFRDNKLVFVHLGNAYQLGRIIGK